MEKNKTFRLGNKSEEKSEEKLLQHRRTNNFETYLGASDDLSYTLTE
jgi:hypothetical protein